MHHSLNQPNSFAQSFWGGAWVESLISVLVSISLFGVKVEGWNPLKTY